MNAASEGRLSNFEKENLWWRESQDTLWSLDSIEQILKGVLRVEKTREFLVSFNIIGYGLINRLGFL